MASDARAASFGGTTCSQLLRGVARRARHDHVPKTTHCTRSPHHAHMPERREELSPWSACVPNDAFPGEFTDRLSLWNLYASTGASIDTWASAVLVCCYGSSCLRICDSVDVILKRQVSVQHPSYPSFILITYYDWHHSPRATTPLGTSTYCNSLPARLSPALQTQLLPTLPTVLPSIP